MRRGRDLLPRIALPAVLLPVLLAGPGAAEGPAGQAEEASRYAGTDLDVSGRLEGRVLAADPPPPFADHHVTSGDAICGRRIPDERILVGPDGAVRNAVVSLENVQSGKPVPTSRRPRLVNAGCRFEPHVISASVGQKLEIVNRDPVRHRTHARMDGLRTVFDVNLPVQNQKIPRLIEAPGIMEVRCEAGHPWMTAWVLTFPHPYHAVTGEAGRFAIGGIPPGTYRVRAWHEVLGTQVMEVRVPAEGEATLVFRRLRR